ncbi:hypothetical protein LWI28_023702 [Acer negundo]|uniref:G protein gamma domain-containing protein n=1 Tax=Acer negundo TaxID=4023 RepID=A0AAD5NKI1_ACENE|nr:hypothetical protein LWI28_023702 [Acer negundo]
MEVACGSAAVEPPMSPRSPPGGGLDLYGKRRQMVKVQVLEREIGLLQEELKSVEDLQPASRCCKELNDFIEAKPDPFIAETAVRAVHHFLHCARAASAAAAVARKKGLVETVANVWDFHASAMLAAASSLQTESVKREFPADAVLGDGSILGGVSLYSGESLPEYKLPLVYGGDCGSRYCNMGRLQSSKVQGKIVVCDRGGNARVEKGSAVKLAGGLGMILANTAENGEELIADSHLLPATMVGEIAGNKVKQYLKLSQSPTATIVFRGMVVGGSPPAPKVAAFSSRGPNHLTPEILKPDVIAPGHVDPNRALNPGLVYDINVIDYVTFLCSIGYDSKRISVFIREPTSSDVCSRALSRPGNLNYPSFSVVFGSNTDVVTYKRVVKNVGGSADAVYEVKVTAPPNVEINVSPNKLVFSAGNTTLSYEVTFSSTAGGLEGSVGVKSHEFGSIEWSDGDHLVRSPIAVMWLQGSTDHSSI